MNISEFTFLLQGLRWTIALSVGGVAPVPADSMATFFARDDIVERRGNLAGGRY